MLHQMDLSSQSRLPANSLLPNLTSDKGVFFVNYVDVALYRSIFSECSLMSGTQQKCHFHALAFDCSHSSKWFDFGTETNKRLLNCSSFYGQSQLQAAAQVAVSWHLFMLWRRNWRQKGNPTELQYYKWRHKASSSAEFALMAAPFKVEQNSPKPAAICLLFTLLEIKTLN